MPGTAASDESVSIVSWNESLSTGIEMIDDQHKQLIALTNQLFHACTRGGDKREAVFKEVMSRMVEYVRIHFTTEQDLIQKIKYPNYAEHKSEHDNLIMRILESSRVYNDGNKNVPNDFVKSLKDWIFSHIGHSDRMYAIFFADQKKKGLLSDKDITG